MDLQFVRQALRPDGCEGLVQRCRGVGVKVVLDKHDPFGVGVALIDQRLDLLRLVTLGTPLRHANPAASGQRLAGEEEADHPAALVFGVDPRRLTRLHRQRRAWLPRQVLARFVEAHLRVTWNVGPVAAISSTSAIRHTSLSASNRKLHRACPWGGALHAMVISRASPTPSSRRWYSRHGGAASQRGRQPLFDVRSADPGDGRLAALDGIRNAHIDPSRTVRGLAGFEQDARMHQVASRRDPGSDQGLQPRSFSGGQDDLVFLVHPESLAGLGQPVTTGVTVH